MTAPASYTRHIQAAARNWKASPADSAKRMFIAGVVLPAIFTAVGEAFILAGAGDDDDTEKALKKIAADVFTSPFIGMPIIRDIMEGVKNNAMQMPYGRELQITPAFEAANEMFKGTREQAKEDSDAIKAIDHYVDAVSMAIGLPYKQAKKLADIAIDIEEGKKIHPARYLGYSKYQLGEK